MKYCNEYVCSVCVSVCLSARIYLEPNAQSLPKFWCMLPMAVSQSSSGTVKKSRREGTVLECILPQWQCKIVQHSNWDPYKNGWTNRDAIWDDQWAWPEEQCVTWGDDPRKGRDNWTGPCSSMHTTGTDVLLQALDESIIGREDRGDGIAYLGQRPRQ